MEPQEAELLRSLLHKVYSKASEKSGHRYTTVCVRWCLGESFDDAPVELLTIAHKSSVEELKTALRQQSAFVGRASRDQKIDREKWSWEEYELTDPETDHATLLPSYRFLKTDHMIDILPNPRRPIHFVDAAGTVRWLFETTTQRLRREFREAQQPQQRQQTAEPQEN